ncbi:trehalose-phosphatase [Verruconis gallopava]|uniref:Trehalose-phosphatase n=1 Tax=Verruconis gallopava TaxID=253628 RepID=A0A0D1XS15_9PEZI|nr:trehalose-phosphatase [Verruconis gallopava]KIW05481.1 trehalose-phosphatase [Verruconis gallopava]
MTKQEESSQSIRVEVPVTPGVVSSGKSTYFEQERPATSSSEKLPFDPAGSTPGPRWNANAYEPSQESAGVNAGSARARGAFPNDELAQDPVKMYPSLNLSGHIISVTFNVPYSIGFVPGKDWDLQPRRGTSSLFDSLSYLASSSSSWNHTLVGWTGEIRKMPDADTLKNVSAPRSKLSEPISLPGMPKPKFIDPNESMLITKADRQRLEKQLERDHGGKIVPVWLTDEGKEGKDDVFTIKDQSRWRRFARKELYTLFHYKQNEPTDAKAARVAWADYYRMNVLFANRVMDVYKPGDVVIVHDYNLMLVPSLLRQRLHTIYVGFFLHIPFPSSEYYRCLGRRKEILEGVLGANMIGFQALSYARHFSSCCTRILGFDSSASGVDAFGSHVAVDVLPIGINAHATEKAAFEDPKVEENIKRIKEMYAGKKIIIGRDRLDAARGITQKLQAFELFLERHPEWEDQVVLIQITSPTDMNTEGRDGESKALEKISELSARINGRYGSIGFSPVRHLPHYLSREEYFALLRSADVGLITSVRDGMNTVSMEYAICQKENHGQLILSEFSGTAHNLEDALHVNPWDLGKVSDAINEALSMSDAERAIRSNKLYEHVRTHNIQNWTKSFIKHLLSSLESFDHSFVTPVLNRVLLLKQYRNADKRIFMFDYDGTLTPIVQDPKSAIPSDRVLRNIKALAADPKNAVWIISGRDQAFLEECFGHVTELGLSAEHGSFVRYPGREDWIDITEEFGKQWQDDVLATFQYFTEKTPGSFIERKKVAVTWHYRRADPEFGAFQASACRKQLERTVATKFDVEVMAGKANLEVRPKFVNKGEIVKALIKEHTDRGQTPGFVFCAGDDFTDEDMFRALNQSGLSTESVFTVTVGPSSKQTLASWHVVDPGDILSTIGLLNGNADEASAGDFVSC